MTFQPENYDALLSARTIAWNSIAAFFALAERDGFEPVLIFGAETFTFVFNNGLILGPYGVPGGYA